MGRPKGAKNKNPQNNVRKYGGMSLQEVADVLGVKRGVVSAIEKKALHKMSIICRQQNIDLADLLYNNKERIGDNDGSIL